MRKKKGKNPSDALEFGIQMSNRALKTLCRKCLLSSDLSCTEMS